MHAKKIICLVAASAMAVASMSTFAQGRDDEHRHEGPPPHAMAPHAMAHQDRRGDYHGQDTYYYGARGPEWHKGGRLPAQYRDHQYVVDNWRMHHLAPPPRGYHWVQVGNDYVLAAIATGIITQLILSNS